MTTSLKEEGDSPDVLPPATQPQFSADFVPTAQQPKSAMKVSSSRGRHPMANKKKMRFVNSSAENVRPMRNNTAENVRCMRNNNNSNAGGATTNALYATQERLVVQALESSSFDGGSSVREKSATRTHIQKRAMSVESQEDHVVLHDSVRKLPRQQRGAAGPKPVKVIMI